MVKQNTIKTISIAGMAIAGYHAISMHFPQLYAIPFLDNTMVIAAAGAATLYGAYMLYSKY